MFEVGCLMIKDPERDCSCMFLIIAHTDCYFCYSSQWCTGAGTIVSVTAVGLGLLRILM